ncbi:MAG: glycine zipper domain-containing protein [Deltaproteobacteria bacterium]|nr:glycine zipper domain-containing protein [Deltaproteobacteria bacterium]
MRVINILLLGLITSFFLSSCVSTGYNTQKGAAIGAGIGAIAGQAIGRNTQATLIGTATGALVGAIIGNSFDQELIWSKMGSNQTKGGSSCPDTNYDECPPGKWIQVPGRWKDGRWVPSHRVWVPQDP